MSIIHCLKITIIKFILILVIISIVSVNSLYGNNLKENKIIFKISNKSYTLIDLYNRIEYLKLVSENTEIDKKFAKEDLKSVIIFNEYYIKNFNKSNKLNQETEDVYNKLIINNNLNQKNINNLEKNIILDNLRFDIIRKQIIENLLNSKRKKIFNEENKKDSEILYKLYVKYLNVNLYDIENSEINIEKVNVKNISEVEKFLQNNNIEYFIKGEEIINIDRVNYKIKNKIKNNINFFYIKNNNLLTFVSVEKSLITYNGLIANLYSFKTDKDYSKDQLKCNKLNDLKNSNIQISNEEYEYYKLNQQIKDSLIEIDDFIIFKTDSIKNYIILCGLRFNEEIINNVNITNKINLYANEIEKDFIDKYSNVFNLEINE